MTLVQLFTAIANAIRAKKGTSGTITASNFPTEIASITTGIDTSDANAAANDIVTGKTAYVNGQKLTGTYTGIIPTGTKQISITQNGTTTEDVTNYANAQITTNVVNQDYEDALVAFGVTEDLADGIEALTTYSNEITGEYDITLSDAIRTLTDGYVPTSKLPSGYVELEYLESNGNQYILIPYRANNKTKLFARYMQIESDSAVAVAFGVTSLAAINNANNGIARITPGKLTGSVNRVAWGGNIIGSTVEIGNVFRDFNTWYEIYFDLNKIYINNTLVATSSQDPSQEWQAQYDFGIFIRGGSTNSLPFIGRISRLYCTENGSKTVNLIPALRESDNKPGMYDMVNDVFYTNAGTGEFSYSEIN